MQCANTLPKDRVFFGSDFSPITPDRWLSDFEEAGLENAATPLILSTARCGC